MGQLAVVARGLYLARHLFTLFIFSISYCLFVILDAVVVELVVRPQGGEGSGADGVGEEYLGGGVYPALRVVQLAPVRGDVQQQAC